MLTKLLGARREQLKTLNDPSVPHNEATHSNHTASVHKNKAVATSNRPPIDSPDPRHDLVLRPVERKSFDAKSDILSLSSFIQSIPTTYQAHLDSKADTIEGLNTDRRFPHRSLVAATPPAMRDLNTSNVNKGGVLDELLDRLETDAKERVYKVADTYCLMSYLYVCIVPIYNTLHPPPLD